jgi:hypothetical protein
MKTTLVVVNLTVIFICLFEAGMLIAAKMPGWGLLIGLAIALIGITNQLRKARF